MTNRRTMLATSLASAGSLALGSVLGPAVATAESSTPPRGTADHVISIWLGGGMGQIDTFDPKRRGDATAKQPGSYYDAVDTSVPGVQVCEHLSRTARLMEHVTAVRTVHHDVIDEHAAAAGRMHTGRPVNATIAYPSIGSIVAHQRPADSDAAPSYVLIGYPSPIRGPGFLGASAGYLYLTDTSRGPAGLSRPASIDDRRAARRAAFSSMIGSETDDTLLRGYDDMIAQSARLAGPEFSRVFELDREPEALRQTYGGEFGQRCLLARRLTERGVRFVEVSHNLNFLNGAGWDVHNGGIEQQHLLIEELDIALSALISDLREKNRLDRTLIAITTEFGRPAGFDSGGGRGHYGKAFSCVLAGGGLRHVGAYGQTDELAQTIVADPVTVPDFFATLLAAVGIDPSKNLYAGDRPVPVTDRGVPIASLF